MTSIEDFVAKHLALIELERESEIAENQLNQEQFSPKELQKKGVCLLNLRLQSKSSGLFGRIVCQFEPFWSGDLSSNSILSGDIVGLQNSHGPVKGENIESGIVSKINANSIQVAFDNDDKIKDLTNEDQYRLLKLANDVTYKRLKDSLNRLNKYNEEKSSRLISVLFDQSELGEPYDNIKINRFNDNLNDSQKDAVEFALRQREIAIIHGPPGTGKSTTIIEIILQAVENGLKVLACAPSNVAVDNLVERLASHKLKLVRLGHPARSFHHLQQYSLDAKLAMSDNHSILNDIRKDIDNTLNQKKGGKRKWSEMKELRKEYRERERKSIREVLASSNVVLSTLTSVNLNGPLKHLPKDSTFDLLIVDECSQSIEAACWASLLLVPKCILAGDHQQLPPTIISKEAAKKGLELTLMERQLNLHKERCMRMLTIQYRMNVDIMQWSSDCLYDSKLVADSTVEKRILADLDYVEENENTTCPLLLIDTAGSNLNELELQDDEMSKGNEGEANLVAMHVESLIESGLKQADIAVITPYNLQVELIRCRLSHKYPNLEIKSVDGFQGREKEAVVLSLVRSNRKGIVGFLAEDRRINVAVTRAKRHVCVICDTLTVSRHKFLESLVNYLQDRGQVRMAEDYLNDNSLLDCVHVEKSDKVDEMLKSKSASKSKTQSKKVNAKSVKNTKTINNATKLSNFNKNTNDKLKEENTDLKRKEFTNQIETYLNDIKDVNDEIGLQFEPNLNAHDRLIVHEIAESLGLIHFSQGEGKERRIVVKRNVINKDIVCQNKIESCEVVEFPYKSEKNNIKKSKKKTFECLINEDEQLLNSISLVEENDEEFKGINDNAETNESSNESTKPEINKISKTKKKKKNKKQTTSNKIEIKDNDDNDDFDNILNKEIERNTHCQFKSCKDSVKILGQFCQFCMEIYCFKHYQAEIHGCSKEAKLRAKDDYKNVMTKPYLTDKKPYRKYLENKLDKKVSKLEESRARKKKDK